MVDTNCLGTASKAALLRIYLAHRRGEPSIDLRKVTADALIRRGFCTRCPSRPSTHVRLTAEGLDWWKHEYEFNG